MGDTALGIAVYNGNVETIKILLEFGKWINDFILGAQTDLSNNNFESPIDVARKQGYQDLVILLSNRR